MGGLLEIQNEPLLPIGMVGQARHKGLILSLPVRDKASATLFLSHVRRSLGEGGSKDGRSHECDRGRRRDRRGAIGERCGCVSGGARLCGGSGGAAAFSAP